MRRCPRCSDEGLVPFELDGVEVDACAACGGVWLDAGEITKLQAYTETKRAFMEQHGGAFASLSAARGKSMRQKLATYDARERGRPAGHPLWGFGTRRTGLLGVLAALLDRD